MNVRQTTKTICYLSLGIALYVVFSLCFQVPIFDNYYICLGYIVMGVYCYSFGPIYGATVGTLGCILYCLLLNGLRGMPGWAFGNLYIGLVLGTLFQQTKKYNSLKADIVEICIVISTCAIAMLFIKSNVESILYSQPMIIRMTKNVYAFISDAFVLVLGLPIYSIMDRIIKINFQYNGGTKDE